MKIFKTIINLIIGLSGLGIIIHLVQKNEELDMKRMSAEASTEFWKSAFKHESRLRIEHMFDTVDWKRLYKKYGWGGDVHWWDKAVTERRRTGKADEVEDLTEE